MALQHDRNNVYVYIQLYDIYNNLTLPLRIITFVNDRGIKLKSYKFIVSERESPKRFEINRNFVFFFFFIFIPLAKLRASKWHDILKMYFGELSIYFRDGW